MQAPLGCESGTLGCLDCYSPACGRPGLCAEGTPAAAIGGGNTAVVGRAEECQEECDLSEDCLFYSYELSTGLCSLKRTCRVEAREGYVYGESYCSGMGYP